MERLIAWRREPSTIRIERPYNIIRGAAISNCVNISGGVKSAAKTNIIITAYLKKSISVRSVTSPSSARKYANTGSSNEIPKPNIILVKKPT